MVSENDKSWTDTDRNWRAAERRSFLCFYVKFEAITGPKCRTSWDAKVHLFTVKRKKTCAMCKTALINVIFSVMISRLLWCDFLPRSVVLKTPSEYLQVVLHTLPFDLLAKQNNSFLPFSPQWRAGNHSPPWASVSLTRSLSDPAWTEAQPLTHTHAQLHGEGEEKNNRIKTRTQWQINQWGSEDHDNLRLQIYFKVLH